MTYLRTLFLIILPLVLSACVTTRNEYIPPASAEGRTCVAQCERNKQQCAAIQANAQSQCQQNYNLALRAYNECKKTDQKNQCIQPRYCYQDTSTCDTNHDSCYRSCGGRIHQVEEEW